MTCHCGSKRFKKVYEDNEYYILVCLNCGTPYRIKQKKNNKRDRSSLRSSNG